MKLSARVYTLKLKHPFRTARLSYTNKKTVILMFEHAGICGYGEASPSRYYHNETIAQILRQVETVNRTRLLYDFENLADTLRRLETHFFNSPALLAGIDICLHDWHAKRLKIPLHTFLSLPATPIPESSITIGLTSIEAIPDRIAELGNKQLLKIKVGSLSDLERLNVVSAHTNARLRIDANAGWSLDQAHTLFQELNKHHIELIEQPLKAGQFRLHDHIRSLTKLPIIADEDCVTVSDLEHIAPYVDGINVKLMKCGGIARSLNLINRAKELKLKVMLGCMIESSIGIAAAAHLGSLADYIDLDGNLLITNDPFPALNTHEGWVSLTTNTGLGISPE
jgi:L-alanine-DL-glutamate epimerase-like enolase superfamily enzyme